ncbi:hypothetical protein ASD50_22030 [Mesorhizobium sp. Root552]|nr:hypothetical protein ASD50_22030 [Mesorhizobium sp. Root552]
MLDPVFTKLLEQLALAQGCAFQKPTAHHPITDGFLSCTVNGPLRRPVSSDQDIKAFVRYNDYRDYQKSMEERHVGIKHGIANCRSQGYHQKVSGVSADGTKAV